MEASWENKRSRSVIPVTYGPMLMKAQMAKLWKNQLEALKGLLWGWSGAEWDDPSSSRRH